MKNKFFNYYRKNEDEIQKIWDDSLIVFDANVLLVLYKSSEDTKNDILSIMKYYSDRLWIPYQVAYEFHDNRINTIFKRKEEHVKLVDQLEKFSNSLKSQYPRHLHTVDIEKIEETTQHVVADLKKREENYPEYNINDSILDAITSLYEGKVGDDFSEEEMKELFKEGGERYKSKIPPGYCDEKEKKDSLPRQLYGDLIIWKQIIKKASADKKNVIFVTGDKKEDWWDEKNGKRIGYRIELSKEFSDSTCHDVHIYTTECFLNYAKEKIKGVRDETISEIEEISAELKLKKFLLDRASQKYGIDYNSLGNSALGVNAKMPFSYPPPTMLGDYKIGPNYTLIPNTEEVGSVGIFGKHGLNFSHENSIIGSLIDPDTGKVSFNPLYKGQTIGSLIGPNAGEVNLTSLYNGKNPVIYIDPNTGKITFKGSLAEE